MPSICVDRNPENVAGELWVPGSCEPRSTGPGCILGPPARQLVPVLGETPESLAPKVPWAERHPREHGACRGRAAEFGPGGGAPLGEWPGDQPRHSGRGVSLGGSTESAPDLVPEEA